MEAPPSNDGTAARGGRQPLFGGHSAAEAGTSRFLPTGVLLATRATWTLWLFASLVYLCAVNRFEMHFLTNWTFALLTLSFALLATGSLLLILRRVGVARKLAQVAVPLHFLASTAALYVVPVYYAFLGKPPFYYRNLIVHGLNLIPIAADVALGARYRFRWAHILLVMAYLALYVVVVWIRFAVWRKHPDYHWPYGFLDFSKQNTGVTIAYYIGFFVWAAIAAVIVIGFNRLATCCEPRKEVEEKVLDEANAHDGHSAQA